MGVPLPTGRQFEMLAQFLNSEGVRLAGSITPTYTTHDATTTSTEAVAANPDRRYLMIANNTDTPVYLMLGADAVVNEGIILAVKGARYEMSPALGNLMLGGVNCIHGGAGTAKLLILEGE